ncbi:MAG: protein of unknown function DUF125, transmembrane, partial [uncultured Chloroflexia bacterium]
LGGMAFGGADGEARSRWPGDDGFRAQQGLRAQGGPAGPDRPDGRLGLDAGARVRGGGGEQGRAAHVPDRARGGRRGGDQHGLLGGALRRRVPHRAGRPGAEGRDHRRRDLRRRHHAHAAVPAAGRRRSALRRLRRRRSRVTSDLLHPLQVLRHELLRERPAGRPRRRARLRLRRVDRQRV